MGHKLHLDQNEKLGMFGVTHVLAIDGFSSKIVADSTMPIKNNLVIYKEVYRQVQSRLLDFHYVELMYNISIITIQSVFATCI